MKDKIIEKVENILYEYGWITRPHGDETDDILRDFESELQSLQESQEQSEGEEKIIQFKTKEQVKAEIRFRHLSDHLDVNPCWRCPDENSEYCLNECKSSK